MKRLFLALCVLTVVLAAHAQGNALIETDEDSTLAVIGYFCKNDSLVYDYTYQKQRIKDADTTTTVDVTTRFLIVVTDSTSEGYKMVFVPQSQEKGKTIYEDGSLTLSDLLTVPMDLTCRFSTDEMGAIQHIDNWMEIRDSLKNNYKKIFDDVYSQHPQLDSILPRQRMESVFLLRCSSESNILQLYEPLKMLLNVHGGEFMLGKDSVETTNELGYPTHIDIEAFYTVPKEETDNDGDYAVVAETTTDMKGADLMTIVGGAMGMLANDSLVGKMNEMIGSDEFTKMKILGVNRELYTFFYNGWPKLMISEKKVNIDGKDALIEERYLEWVSLHWTVVEDTEDDSEKQNM